MQDANTRQLGQNGGGKNCIGGIRTASTPMSRNYLHVGIARQRAYQRAIKARTTKLINQRRCEAFAPDSSRFLALFDYLPTQSVNKRPFFGPFLVKLHYTTLKGN
ncbi:hypothetical protein IF1G_02382 [Cordyceps javanica]|uniref:Uncharacterized protein n=1 Tax=Cordyceps javanica TaxID=43265 RepID=A0A545V9A5_9HYPO|nr:hypothetical protein IF1G_02382 [Cordyceps javanica]